MKHIPPPHELSLEDHSKGGKAAAARRAEKRSMQDTAKALLSMKIGTKMSEQDGVQLAKYIKPDMTVKEALVLTQTVKAIMFLDTQAATFVRDTAGEKPTEKVNMEANVNAYVNLLKKAVGDEM